METPLPAWTDAELDDCVLKLCDEFPESRMVACSRAIEYCRRMTPRGSAESLLSAMRDVLQQEAALQTTRHGKAA